MATEVKSAFTAVPQSTLSFLQANGQGCYVPAFQREYSWSKDNVDRLFEDARGGLNSLPTRLTTISFLGTIIAIHDTKYLSVRPAFTDQMPQKVMTIIDGQQRLSTFVLIFIALHHRIDRLREKAERLDEDETAKWLAASARRMLPTLLGSVRLDMNDGEGIYQYYPRLIRAYHDVWSTNGRDAKYEGSIANVTWQYLQFWMDKASGTFKPETPKDAPPETHKVVASIYRVIERNLKDLCSRKDEAENALDVQELMASADFGLELFGYDVPGDVQARFKGEFEEKGADKTLYDLATLIVTALYMQKRMAFTVVEAKGEDDAFDMFEALNTTGEPLTAFETFKPKIIEAESIQHYEGSESHRQIQRVEGYLNRFEKAEEKQKATASMLVPFALAETGTRLAGKLNEQRRYLRGQFDEIEATKDKPKREGFVRRLGDMAELIDTSWDLKKETKAKFGGLPVEWEAARVAHEYLRQLNHSITLAPLARFFGQAIHADSSHKAAAVKTFEQALAATGAFAVLWRSAFGTTTNIDARFRDLMREGIDTDPFAARPKGNAAILDIDVYRQALWAALKREKIGTKAEWILEAKGTPIYEKSKPTARMLLLLSAHDAVEDDSLPGLLRRGRAHVRPTLTVRELERISALEIEHVAPKSPDESDGTWENSIYESKDLPHSIGNLTVVPKLENIVLSNRPWKAKRAIYRVLGATTQEEFRDAVGQLPDIGVDLSERATEIVDQSIHADVLVPLSAVEDWNPAFIERRSERLCELAWDQLQDWLPGAP
ncbi:DUF262 domain-containing HNH endonuclease family protein [Ahrensia sp. R2A130]|uniref:DUF262 domain-containing protein n=1 Tax=Ahrensia sp. R2A130 TaxID=744979 RepID=UPI0001E0BC6E|nr:DUF262 domain-containing HNH endonuclease family protein [Ahrensia sp. R2A130]EFL89440.1 conserved hypothetical protein [Ahrensia sp. R2A130]